MLVGVVSDTHNNVKNIGKIINIFNKEEVDLVIHTGDISNAEALRLFSDLNCHMLGTFGNNDRPEIGLKEVCKDLKFNFNEPPVSLTLQEKKIAIFHEPELIDAYIKDHKALDLVLHGHTHRYRKEIIKGTIYFNPGESAGLLEGKNAIGLINMDDLKIRRIFF